MEKMNPVFPSMLGSKKLFISPRKLIKNVNMPASPRLQTERLGLPKTTLEDIISVPKCIINKMHRLAKTQSGDLVFGLQLISLAYNHNPKTGKLDFSSPARDKQGNIGVMVYQLTIVVDSADPKFSKASLHLLYEDSIYNDNPHKYAFLNRLEQSGTHTRDKFAVEPTPHIHIPAPKNIITSASETALTSLYHCTPEVYKTQKLLEFEQIINAYYSMYNIQNDLTSAIDLQDTIPDFIHSQDGKIWLDSIHKPVIIDSDKREQIIKTSTSKPSQISREIRRL